MPKTPKDQTPSPEALSRWENEGGKRLKRPRDPVQLGKMIGDILTGQVEDAAPPVPTDPNKDQAAAELGRRGGLKGGRARVGNV